MTPRAALERGIDELALGMPAHGLERLLAYVDLLTKWNRTYNLTAIRDPLEIVTRHLLDSLAALPHLPMPDEGWLGDIGSGAGLPGIPLAIARPNWRVMLNDSSQKKTAFLRQAAIELGLENVSVHEGRVESWRPAARCAIAISRAFTDLAEFIARCRHVVAPGGVLAAMKGELPTLPEPACRVIALKVPMLNAQRHLVLCPVAGA